MGSALRYACPRCRGPVYPSTQAYECRACERRFKIHSWGADFLIDPPQSVESQAERIGRDREARDYEASQIRDKGPSYWRMHNAFVLSSLRDAPPGPVLDAGCGTGLVTRALPATGRSVVAADFSEASLQVLAEKRLPGVECVLADLIAVPLPDGCLAAVVCSLVLQHVPPVERALVYAEFSRCLAPGGKLIVIAYNEARFRYRRLPATGVFGSGIPYYSFRQEALVREAREAGFGSIAVRPLGFALHARARRGGGFAYRRFGRLLNRLEEGVNRRLAPNRPYASEYWLMSAGKP